MALDPWAPPSQTTVPASVRIIEAVAELEGVDPLALEPGLDEVIDTDALDYLLRHDGAPFTLEFSYGTHHVLLTETAIHIDGRTTLYHD
ncbi:HalOD1 output domain-containing protein [Halomicroarcula sp. GCM10025324]|uniref:HalOD1 output domain-containing protein n=1 Tax=Haloarcula TaxID=2237 RepID=UPI0023E75B2F|nr:HalOD1 output domain-containing protein [Halomicroarcula sp. ZS-22-S1]